MLTNSIAKQLEIRRLVLLTLSLLIFIGVAISGCNHSSEEETNTPPKPSGLNGLELAKIHCSGCHQFPEPQLLPKEIWRKSVLPQMALRLGQGNYMAELMTFPPEEVVAILTTGVYPEVPVIADEDWNKIVAYYTENAPEKLVEIPLQKTSQLTGFSIYNPKFDNTGVVTTQFNEHNNTIFVGTLDNKVTNLTPNSPAIIRDTVSVESQSIKRIFHKKYGELRLEIGLLDPSDLSAGKLKAGNKTLIKDLHRPVDMILADVNEDGTEDFVIANFGNLQGNLSWYDGNTFEQHVLSNEAGARVIYHLDFDKDGKKDIIALMTQGRESVVLYKSIGRGRFTTTTLLSFPPVYGSSYFNVLDFDKDGDLDIVYTNGDNADYSMVKKPYHGVRIFANNGKNRFKQAYFYPINGASKVIINDFDKDGDNDMAVISYFPDKLLNEGFLYFEQQENLSFLIKSLKNISSEKWLTLDCGDFDKDGDIDIVLGTLAKNGETLPKLGAISILFNELNAK